MGREGRDYWEEQLSEYWDSGLTIQEYSELKELPYESTRRWIRVLEKARQDDVSDPESLELVEIKPLQTNANDNSGIRLLIDGIEIAVAKGFDGTTLSGMSPVTPMPEVDVALFKIRRVRLPNLCLRIFFLNHPPNLLPDPATVVIRADKQKIQRIDLCLRMDGNNHAADRVPVGNDPKRFSVFCVNG